MSTPSPPSRGTSYNAPESYTVRLFPSLSLSTLRFAPQRDTAKSEALLREIETLYAKVQSTNRTEGAERRLAQLRLRSAWAALNLTRLSGNKATEKRDAAIRKAIATKTLILLRAQRRSPEGAQQVCWLCAMMPVMHVRSTSAVVLDTT